jgi:hypothetical protein
MNTRSVWITILIAGAAIGLLGSLPVLNLANCILCIWVWLGGALAVYIYRRLQAGQDIPTVKQGAGLGALSGLAGAFFGAIIFALGSSITIPIMNKIASLAEVGDMPFGGLDAGSILGSTLIFLLIDAVLYPAFGAIGGAIAASLYQKKAQPQG